MQIESESDYGSIGCFACMANSLAMSLFTLDGETDDGEYGNGSGLELIT